MRSSNIVCFLIYKSDTDSGTREFSRKVMIHQALSAGAARLTEHESQKHGIEKRIDDIEKRLASFLTIILPKATPSDAEKLPREAHQFAHEIVLSATQLKGGFSKEPTSVYLCYFPKDGALYDPNTIELEYGGGDIIDLCLFPGLCRKGDGKGNPVVVVKAKAVLETP
jgi:hypothetical protein